MKTLVILLTLFTYFLAQDLFMPRDVKAAYKKETRSFDGKPGKNYWQNYGRYSIQMTLTPPNRNIKGKETITYFNNSPDTIRRPNIKLILNIHKAGAPRDGGVSEDYLTSGIHVDNVTYNGTKIKWSDFGAFTNKSFALPKPLAPKDSAIFTFEWNYDISLESNREGLLDSTTFFCAYFYPRIAVYDDYLGWDKMNFTDAIEFYNDFNDYNLTVSVPKNFLVWATGDLINAKDVLQTKYLNKYNESLYSDSVVNIVKKEDYEAKKVTAQNEMNNWIFTTTKIPDVTFAISDHYVWDAASVIVDKKTYRRASTQAAYIDTAVDYREMVKIAQHSLSWFSNNIPGVPYPYSKTTVVQGVADMEYPMMVNDSPFENYEFARFVAEHEIAHTYFPFYMGTNETRFGFMDEGWATTLELFIGRYDLGKEKAEENYKNFRVRGWINDPNQEQDVAIITPGNALTGRGRGNNSYGKASLGYLAMQDLLGEELFLKCLHEYMERWNTKHPTPWDFFFTFNNAANKNLDWFWTNWFMSNGYIDFSLDKVKKEKKGYSVTVKNIGGYVAPFDIFVTYSDDSKETLHKTPEFWQKNQKENTFMINTKKKIKSINIDGGIFMDADTINNTWSDQK